MGSSENVDFKITAINHGNQLVIKHQVAFSPPKWPRVQNNSMICGLKKRKTIILPSQPLSITEKNHFIALITTQIDSKFKNMHWIDLRENLQETMVFTINYKAFL